MAQPNRNLVWDPLTPSPQARKFPVRAEASRQNRGLHSVLQQYPCKTFQMDVHWTSAKRLNAQSIKNRPDSVVVEPKLRQCVLARSASEGHDQPLIHFSQLRLRSLVVTLASASGYFPQWKNASAGTLNTHPSPSYNRAE